VTAGVGVASNAELPEDARFAQRCALTPPVRADTFKRASAGSQLERWDTKVQLSQTIFEWIEAWYNPRRRHNSIDDLAPVADEQCAAAKRYGSAARWLSLPRRVGKPNQL
jgi:hypothetical protein